jgi:hypothetical protein
VLGPDALIALFFGGHVNIAPIAALQHFAAVQHFQALGVPRTFC